MAAIVGREQFLNVVCAVAISVVVAGCSTNNAAQPVASASAQPATAAPSTSQPATPAPSVAAPRVVTGTVGFQSPSRNIQCDMFGRNDAGYSVARCDTAVHNWKVPPRPPNGCGGDWYGRIAIDEDRALFVCASEGLKTGPVLPYGQALRDGSIVCESLEQGVRCTSQVSGHGFTLSRQNYTLY